MELNSFLPEQSFINPRLTHEEIMAVKLPLPADAQIIWNHAGKVFLLQTQEEILSEANFWTKLYSYKTIMKFHKPVLTELGHHEISQSNVNTTGKLEPTEKITFYVTYQR